MDLNHRGRNPVDLFPRVVPCDSKLLINTLQICAVELIFLGNLTSKQHADESKS